MNIRRTIRRMRRRRALLACRAHLLALGYDAGDLLQPRVYRPFLRQLRGICRQQAKLGVRAHALVRAMKIITADVRAYDRAASNHT